MDRAVPGGGGHAGHFPQPAQGAVAIQHGQGRVSRTGARPDQHLLLTVSVQVRGQDTLAPASRPGDAPAPVAPPRFQRPVGIPGKGESLNPSIAGLNHEFVPAVVVQIGHHRGGGESSPRSPAVGGRTLRVEDLDITLVVAHQDLWPTVLVQIAHGQGLQLHPGIHRPRALFAPLPFRIRAHGQKTLGSGIGVVVDCHQEFSPALAIPVRGEGRFGIVGAGARADPVLHPGVGLQAALGSLPEFLPRPPGTTENRKPRVFPGGQVGLLRNQQLGASVAVHIADRLQVTVPALVLQLSGGPVVEVQTPVFVVDRKGDFRASVAVHIADRVRREVQQVSGERIPPSPELAPEHVALSALRFDDHHLQGDQVVHHHDFVDAVLVDVRHTALAVVALFLAAGLPLEAELVVAVLQIQDHHTPLHSRDDFTHPVVVDVSHRRGGVGPDRALVEFPLPDQFSLGRAFREGEEVRRVVLLAFGQGGDLEPPASGIELAHVRAPVRRPGRGRAPEDRTIHPGDDHRPAQDDLFPAIFVHIGDGHDRSLDRAFPLLLPVDGGGNQPSGLLAQDFHFPVAIHIFDHRALHPPPAQVIAPFQRGFANGSGGRRMP